MVHWWQERWLRLHATAAPFGISITTLLLTLYLESWQWQGRASWELAGDLVDLGTAFYAMAAVLFERGFNFMFWAWEQHKKRMAQRRAEAQADLLATIRAKARAEDRPEIAAWLEQAVRDNGISHDTPSER